VYDSVAVTSFKSVSSTVNVDVPADVGVPLMRPLAGVKLRPAGSEPDVIDQA